jgi:tRNA acetyltransferase TAN1
MIYSNPLVIWDFVTAGPKKTIIHQVASEIWPIAEPDPRESADEDSDNELSVETQIAQEVFALKRPKPEPRFGERYASPISELLLMSCYQVNCQTNTPCGTVIVVSTLYCLSLYDD